MDSAQQQVKLAKKMVVSGPMSVVMAILEDLANNMLDFSEEHVVPVVLFTDEEHRGRKGFFKHKGRRFSFFSAFDDQAVSALQEQHGNFLLADSIEAVRNSIRDCTQQTAEA